MVLKLLSLSFIITRIIAQDVVIEKPHIVVFMADDLGWNDVSYHGSDQILTPNIDAIAYQGIILQHHYTDTFGTASRSAFFTGKYPFRLGTQGRSILGGEDRGVPVTEKLLPSYLKELDYATHLVGKWGLGKSREHFHPTNRGFDSFFGFLDDSVDYFTYNRIEAWNKTEYFGLNLHHNMTPVEDVTGHLTDVLTNHAIKLIKEHDVSTPLYLHVAHAAPHVGGGLANLQPPADDIEANYYIAHSARRLYASMVTSLDRSVGHIISALAEKDILKNTLIIFMSDNNADTEGLTKNFGSNLPLRGYKGTPWEGGLRSNSIIWHPEVPSDIWEEMFHVTDWLPTLVAAAGGNVPENIDGVNQWESIKDDKPSNRKDIILTVDDLNGWAAIREGDFKYIVGEISTGISGYYGKPLLKVKSDPPNYEEILLDCDAARIFKETLEKELDIDIVLSLRNDSTLDQSNLVQDNELCVPTKAKGCLFNVREDPLEAHDLWNSSPEIIKHLTLRLRTIWMEMKPRSEPHFDIRADPLLHNFVWTSWLQDDDPVPEALVTAPSFPLQVSRAEIQYLVDLNLNSFKAKVYDYIENTGQSFVKSVSGLFNFK